MSSSPDTGRVRCHDEPELNPLANLPGPAKNVTWSFVLPVNGDPWGSRAPLVMHAGDAIDGYYFVTAAKDGRHNPRQGFHGGRRRLDPCTATVLHPVAHQ
jgi:hypothetical protein